MPATTQHIGLETGLTFERNKTGLHRPTTAHELLHNTNLVVRNVAEEPGHEDDEQYDTDDDRRDQ